jgi:hypothetical protein
MLRKMLVLAVGYLQWQIVRLLLVVAPILVVVAVMVASVVVVVVAVVVEVAVLHALDLVHHVLVVDYDYGRYHLEPLLAVVDLLVRSLHWYSLDPPDPPT